jgi:hypothetical protein
VDRPVERHQVLFLNPDLAGLFAAYLSHRAGAKVAVVDEVGRWRSVDKDGPAEFPASGTFCPWMVDTMATEAGFSPPIWQRIPLLQIHTPVGEVELNSDDGVGGLLIALGQACAHARSVLVSWLQEQVKKAKEYSSAKRPAPGALRQVETSVAEALMKLHLPEQDRVLLLLDTLSIVVLGRGVIQLDVRDFPRVVAGILAGWHAPAPGEGSWGEILAKRLKEEGARWHELESVSAIQSFAKRRSVIRGSDGTLFAANILVVPESDRYRHPAAPEAGGIIRWRTWRGRIPERAAGPPFVGVLRYDAKRPPVNDNFIGYHVRPEEGGRFAVCAPVEDRYLRHGTTERLAALTARIQALLSRRLRWKIEEFSAPPGDPLGRIITLPGSSTSVSYPEGPLWGDDVLARLKAADRLSRRVLGRLE